MREELNRSPTRWRNFLEEIGAGPCRPQWAWYLKSDTTERNDSSESNKAKPKVLTKNQSSGVWDKQARAEELESARSLWELTQEKEKARKRLEFFKRNGYSKEEIHACELELAENTDEFIKDEFNSNLPREEKRRERKVWENDSIPSARNEIRRLIVPDGAKIVYRPSTQEQARAKILAEQKDITLRADSHMSAAWTIMQANESKEAEKYNSISFVRDGKLILQCWWSEKHRKLMVDK